MLDYQRGNPGRLTALLELSDEDLIRAIGGRRRQELSRAWSTYSPSVPRGSSGGAVCRHSRHWPARLRDCSPPRMLWLTLSPARVERLLEAPTVAFLGTHDPSPYGAAMAGAIARGLSAAGVRTLAPLGGRLGAAAHRGALESGGSPLALAGDGLASIRPAPAVRLARDLDRRGCVLSELPPAATGRGWGVHAAVRSVVALADLVVLVEAQGGSREMLGAGIAASLGRPVAALPGLATSPLSTGPHSLIRGGALLVRDAGDVLEALSELGRAALKPALPQASPPAALAPGLRAILTRVGAGEDTPERLSRGAEDPGAVMAALGELEADGLIERMPGGRYAACQPARIDDPAR